MTASIRTSLLLLAIICPIYVAIIGSCCNDQCEDTNPCTSECYPKPAGGCPSPADNPYNAADGTECPLSAGVYGQCSGGTCGTNECVGLTDLQSCNYPRNGGTEGICIEQRCVSAGESDPCVKYNFGRINCCSIEGCNSANGVLCGTDSSALNGTACDPTGVLPVGQGSGSCQNGYCVHGQCTGQCSQTSPCQSADCNPGTGQCALAQNVGDTLDCNPPAEPPGSGYCWGGDCKDAAPCDVNCDDNNPCTKDTCNLKKFIKGMCPDQVCCEHEPSDTSTPTKCTLPGGTGEGVCDSAGLCIPAVCG